VGRGKHASYCLLLPGTSNTETRKRLAVMEATQDGFVIAEQDLQLRGPGEYLGTRQSGLPDFILADLVNDQAILEQARKAAQHWFANPTATQTEHPDLWAAVQRRSEGHAALLQSG
jgi:ATP-dependent DNA helicase RecG